MTKNGRKKIKISVSQVQERTGVSEEQAKNKEVLKEAIEFVNEGDIESLRTIIEKYPKVVNEGDEVKNSLLHYAVARGNKEIAELLLEKGADIESKDCFGSTSLHVAACDVNLEMVKFLVEEGRANINVTNKHNKSVLHSAASGIIGEEGKEDWEVVEYLLEKGSRTDIVTRSGFTVSDIFRSKDWSYAETYEKIKKEVKNGEAKTKVSEKKKLEKELEEILEILLPEENSDDCSSIGSLLETIVLNQKRLVEKDDELIRKNLDIAKEFVISKGLEREKIEELCAKSAKLAEITMKNNRIEFIEEQGKPWMVKFGH